MINPLNIFKIKDLRYKVFSIIGLLAVSRLLASIPVPNVDFERLKNLFSSNQLLGFLDIFSGGGLSNLSIAMLGVGPYITATIIMQLLTIVFPNLKKMYYEEGEMGRAKFNRVSRLITIPLALVQSYGFLNFLNSRGVFTDLSGWNIFTDMIIITAGSVILMWLGELISEYHLGNGISLLIFSGIIAGLPANLRLAAFSFDASMLQSYFLFAAISVVVIAGVVFINEGERKIPISYARRVRGNKLYGGVSSYLPLKVNQAGVIPIIFAVSVLLFPQFIAQAVSLFSSDLSIKMNEWVLYLFNNGWIYGISYFIMVVLFTYFYTAVTFDPSEISKNLQKSGGFIPGLRPGEQTSSYLAKITGRTTLFGAVFLGLIAVLPNIVQGLTGISMFRLGGTSLLIVVSVALEIMRQVESQLAIRQYE
ncbi:MAG: preprotein translocase subunit SecY [Candidatus Pacebacteria bacterium]|nr:preprotein translocase subunit SecY [Candidatus Paceibacterota bacterium]